MTITMMSIFALIMILAVVSALVASSSLNPPVDQHQLSSSSKQPGTLTRQRRQAVLLPGSGYGGYGDYGGYDYGYDNGYGYGRRVGAGRASYGNYLSYYGAGVYGGGGGGYSRNDCFRRCLQTGRVNCEMQCRRYG